MSETAQPDHRVRIFHATEEAINPDDLEIAMEIARRFPKATTCRLSLSGEIGDTVVLYDVYWNGGIKEREVPPLEIAEAARRFITDELEDADEETMAFLLGR